jgi:DNA-binding SARP family transcriptional activator
MKSLAVRVLGDFGVDGLAPHALGSRKARQVLHLLALGQGAVVRTDLLTDALWAATPPARPEDQLSVLVSRLRSVLGGRERIGHQDGGYRLHYDWLDAAELASLIDEVTARREAGHVAGAAAAARVALSLVRGPGPATAAPGEWAAQRQAELTRLAGRARRVAARLLLEAGDWATAADAATAALDQDPYDESALRLLLRAYAAGGQLAAALAAYARTRERLAGELGTDPAPETVALHTAILRGERLAGSTAPASPAPAAAAAATHPSGQPRIVGRDDELGYLDTIAGRARGGRTEIVIVEGEAGIGKTTLLRSWAARRAAAGDTILLASCGPLDRSMPLDALLTALAALLRRRGPEAAATLMDADAAILAPLLDTAAGPGQLSQLTGLADSMLGPAVLYAALTRVLRRLTEASAGASAGAGAGALVAVIDDAHLAGPALADLLRFAARQDLSLAVVAAVRTGEGVPLPSTARIQLTALTRAAVEELVGPGRAARLYDRSRGHPLFLTELAQQTAAAELPASLVESVAARCDELGPTGSLLRTAAVIGPELDVDLLAALSGRGVVDVLDYAAQAAAKQFLAEDGGVFRFRHELVREALAASASAGRSALLHRQAGRVLATRPGADPATVAGHARLGGDVALASAALCDAADRAAERFDHAAAEALLDDAVRLDPQPQAWLARARVRTRRGDYDAALRDVDRAATAAGTVGGESFSRSTEAAARAAPAGPAALEVGAWASYFGRRFTQAAQFAADGALAAGDVPTRARCLAVGGRIGHAAGDLAAAETLLGEALTIAAGADRVTAAAWLGVLRAHQSRVPEALELLRPAARGQIGVEHTSATLHALLFLGLAHAAAGRPQQALDAFARYTAEVERRQVPRFAGRGVNLTGWVLRSLGARAQAADLHAAALEIGRGHGTAEVTIAALEDHAEQCVENGDPDGAAAWLAQASDLLRGDLVFGWRLDMKLRLLTARLALLCGEPDRAAGQARELERRAQDLAIPRYVSVARLLRHRADHRLGQPASREQVAADLDLLDSSVAIEAWWWTGDLAADYGVPAWLDRAAGHVAGLARHAGSYAGGLQDAAARRMQSWQSLIDRHPAR